jgi:NADH:ubiquinone oxidoreductase subunit F (NADH-binding)
VSGIRLLAGPELTAGAEGYAAHSIRLGPLPAGGKELIGTLDRSGLAGRGGASFPVASKWRAVAARSRGSAVVVVNGAEGEPQSRKDRVLMAARPHLVLDGALLAASTVNANRVVLYIGEGHHTARAAMARALAERPAAERRPLSTMVAPPRYVAGESSAAVHLIDAGIARPTNTPPQPHERGIGGVTTLVQNVETLAHVALIARHGDRWFRSAGRNGAAGTLLITIAGAIAIPGVIEVEAGTTISELVAMAGGLSEPADAVLVGGYFGAWVEAPRAWGLALESESLRSQGLTLGCGVVAVLPRTRCAVCETAQIMRFLASESSAQCGPCYFGLRALADACGRLAERGSNSDDVQRLYRWATEVSGRGACRHPDGAVMFLRSALTTFASAFANHPAHWRAQSTGAAVPA